MRNNIARHGTALSETVLILPFILVILSLLFFFGRSLTRLQRASVMDRYEAWRYVHDAPGPAAIRLPQPGQWSTDQLNEAFFRGRADQIVGGPTRRRLADSGNVLAEEVARRSVDAAQYARALLDRLPSSVQVRFETTHTSAVPLWQRVEGPILQQHSRSDNDWKYANGIRFNGDRSKWEPAPPLVTPAEVVRDEFLRRLDDALVPATESGLGLSWAIRSYYLLEPPYGGPDLPPDWLTNE